MEPENIHRLYDSKDDYMAEVYYYVHVNEVEYILECGLKLSDWYDKEVPINGIRKKCISAYLNPKDDTEKFNNNNLVCLKLDIPSHYCHIADKYLYSVGLNIPLVMDFYLESIIPVKKYMFGFHRSPECLVTTTVIGEQISTMCKIKDSPVIIDDSERLYMYNLIEINKERYPDFEDRSLYHFYSNLAKSENISKIEDKEKKTAIFIDEEVKRAMVIKIPEEAQNPETAGYKKD